MKKQNANLKKYKKKIQTYVTYKKRKIFRKKLINYKKLR